MPVSEQTLVKEPTVQTSRGRLAAAIAFLVLLNAGLVLWLPAYVHNHFSLHYNAAEFADGYEQIAWNLVQGHGYRIFPDASLTMLRTPGFVLLLAMIFSVCGQSLFVVQVVNLVFAVVTAVLTNVLARRAGLSRVASFVASVIVLFYPGTIFAESRGGPEVMLTLCLVASVLLALIAIERRAWWIFAAAGVVNGVGMLVKPTMATVVPVLLLFAIWKVRDGSARKRLFAGMVICGVVTIAVMAPWVVRNYRISGEFIPTMTLSGLATFEGAYVIQHLDDGLDSRQTLDRAADAQMAVANAMGLRVHGQQDYGAISAEDPGRPFFPQFFKVEDEVAFYRELGRQGVEGYKQQPSLILRAIAHNTWAFWVQGKTRKATVMNTILVLPLLALVLIGLRIGLKRGLYVWPLVLAIVVFVLPHLIIFAYARYYIPLLPFLAILAAIPLGSWFKRFELSRA